MLFYLLDTKTFLRVGFRQISETVGTELDPYWIFALPSFFKDPIRTFEEVDQCPLIEPPDLPLKPEGIDNDIRQVLIKFHKQWHGILDFVSAIQQKMFDVQELKYVVKMVGRPDDLSNQSWSELIAKFRGVNLSKNEEALVTRRRHELLHHVRDVLVPNSIDTLKNAVMNLVQRGGSVRKSYAINWSSRLRLPQFVDFLIEMVPPEERVAEAMSTLDHSGLSPLHCAVLDTPDFYDRGYIVNMVEKLIMLGADPNVKSPLTGLTPIGLYRSIMSHKMDVGGSNGLHHCDRNFFGRRNFDKLSEWRPFHRKMEALLRPSLGETNYDIEVKCKVLDHEDDEEDCIIS